MTAFSEECDLQILKISIREKKRSFLSILLLTVTDDSAQGISFEVKLNVHVLSLRVKEQQLDFIAIVYF